MSDPNETQFMSRKDFITALQKAERERDALREELFKLRYIHSEAAASQRLADVCPGPQTCQYRIAELTHQREGLRAEIETTKGAMQADDDRLHVAGVRVGLYFGCDTAERMADEIVSLRARVAEMSELEKKLESDWDDAFRESMHRLTEILDSAGVPKVAEKTGIYTAYYGLVDRIKILSTERDALRARMGELERLVSILESATVTDGWIQVAPQFVSKMRAAVDAPESETK